METLPFFQFSQYRDEQTWIFPKVFMAIFIHSTSENPFPNNIYWTPILCWILSQNNTSAHKCVGPSSKHLTYVILNLLTVINTTNPQNKCRWHYPYFRDKDTPVQQSLVTCQKSHSTSLWTYVLTPGPVLFPPYYSAFLKYTVFAVSVNYVDRTEFYLLKIK